MMKGSTLDKEKYTMYNLRRRVGTRKCNGVKPSALGNNRFKEKPETAETTGTQRVSGRGDGQRQSEGTRNGILWEGKPCWSFWEVC